MPRTIFIFLEQSLMSGEAILFTLDKEANPKDIANFSTFLLCGIFAQMQKKACKNLLFR